MSFIFTLLLLLIFAACLGFLYPEGMWSNAVRLVNVIFSALLATNFYEPVARLAEEKIDSSLTFFYDYLALWGIFAVSMVVLRAATGAISQVKVRFIKIADQIGSGVFAALIGWVIVSFATMTLHTAPLARTFLQGGFDPDSSSKFLGMNPDVQWLSFFYGLSNGAYATDPANPFDPRGAFVDKYAKRREKVEQYREKRNAFRVEGGDMDSVAPGP